MQRLGEFTTNQWLALGIKLGGADKVRQLHSCDTVTVEFNAADKSAVVNAEPLPACLRFRGNEELPACNARFDPEYFFKTGKGLYVWDDFVNRIRTVATAVESLAETMISSFDLTQDATDEQIRAALLSEHVFEDTSMFCAHLAGMIERQSGGTEGRLLNNGYANIFYVRGARGEVFAVRVRWHGGYREWSVRAYALVDCRWIEGFRVFSRTAAA